MKPEVEEDVVRITQQSADALQAVDRTWSQKHMACNLPIFELGVGGSSVARGPRDRNGDGR